MQRIKPIVLLFILSALQGCTGIQSRKTSPDTEAILSRLQTPVSETNKRVEYAHAVVEADNIVADYLTQHNWQAQAKASVYDSIEIFATQQELWNRIKEVNGITTDIPMPTAGLVAGLEARVLLAVTPEEYQRISPTYASAQKDFWMRLLAHEIAHRRHAVILGGNEDAMGPTWFFEGFAVLVSGQNIDSDLYYTSTDEALTQVAEKKPGAYSRYVAAVRFFLTKTTLPELVAHAGMTDFETWLKTL
ncbi:MAG: hypothetical protein A2X28_09565 [Elusimicrobia bacterium GWA2_56_46]|nr:MAG: hypothetical protein A2X28_09565 [Elusimicrobia bacterium GWA2_56_46]OGR55539.1 MAG: hypothetical protein A2X39_08405 [Elusimicrobia bacterium GWC2_56_31]HBW22059.1 hypothetical protein [Elusimicrobiota bacterium]